MSDLINQLGIDWRSLLTQAVNFLFLLVVLRVFVYKPVLKILKERKAKAEETIVKSKEADEWLRDAQEIGKEKIKAAEGQALNIIRQTEEGARGLEAKLLDEARKKETEALKKTAVLLAAKEEEAKAEMKKQAAKLVKDALVKTVELSPDKIDEALVRRAVEEAVNS